MTDATRIRVFIDGADVPDAMDAVLNSATDGVPAYISDVVARVRDAACSFDGEWNTATRVLPASHTPLRQGQAAVLDAYIDAANLSAGLVLHTWAAGERPIAVTATTEQYGSTARTIIANMDISVPNDATAALWGPVGQFVPGTDINTDLLMAEHRRIERTRPSYPDIKTARVIGEMERANEQITDTLERVEQSTRAAHDAVHATALRVQQLQEGLP